MVAGHRATRRQAITAAEQEKDEEKKRKSLKRKENESREKRVGMDEH